MDLVFDVLQVWCPGGGMSSPCACKKKGGVAVCKCLLGAGTLIWHRCAASLAGGGRGGCWFVRRGGGGVVGRLSCGVIWAGFWYATGVFVWRGGRGGC
jgi:hypothetical protein